MTIKTRQDLEAKVLEYRPDLKERLQNDPDARGKLERIVERDFGTYQPFLGGLTQTTGKAGRALGYVGDVVFWGSALAAAANPLLAPYMITGLLLKKGQVAAQVPEAAKSVKYIVKTGDVAGGIRNIGAKILSYLPGATFVDRGLGRIAEGKMVKRAMYDVDAAFKMEGKKWYERTAEEAEEAGYTDVQVRSGNIIRPNFGRERVGEKRKLAA
jgi:hypothetical protein